MLEPKFDPQPCSYSDDDLLNIIHKFKDTDLIDKIKLQGVYTLTSDNIYYKITAGEQNVYIYEVDFISNLDYEIRSIKETLGPNIRLYEVKEGLSFDKSLPVISSRKYTRPNDWDEISKYVTEYSGVNECYFKFLVTIN